MDSHTFFDKPARQVTPETNSHSSPVTNSNSGTRYSNTPLNNNNNNNNNNNINVELNGRVTELERRLIMFETMFHALSGKLDQHFKRYDMIIQSQQQQVNALNSIVSTLLNDQVTNAEIIRDKLSHNVNDISSQSNIINGMSMVTGQPHQMHMTGNDGARTNNIMFVQADTDELLEDILNNDTPSASDDHTNSNSNPATTATTSTTNNSNSMASTRSQSNVMGMDKPPIFVKETYDPNNDTTEKSTVHIQYPNITDFSTNDNFNNNTSQQLTQNNITPSETNQHLHQKYQNHQKYHNGIQQITEFKFIKSPHSVREIWLEYVEGVKGQPSIKDMETLYQSAWRREASVTKRYSRRKVLCKAIENGLSKGYDLENIINILENHRIIDHENGIKQPIGWLCRPANIPQIFK